MTNYKPIPISQPPEMKGKYFALEVNHGQPEWRQLWYEPYNDSWHEDGDQFHPTHWLMPVADSIILTQSELEKIVGDAFDNVEKFDKQTFIDNLLTGK